LIFIFLQVPFYTNLTNLLKVLLKKSPSTFVLEGLFFKNETYRTISVCHLF